MRIGVRHGLATLASAGVAAVIAVALATGHSSAAHAPRAGTLAFVNDGRLHLARADGTAPRSTAHPADGYPVWSPDGRRIAFAIRDERRTGLYVVDADGGNRRLIARGRGYDCIWLAWSPNGRRIAFTRNEGCEGDMRIWTVNADGTALRPLAPGYGHSDPAWSPDGRRILFTSDRSLWLIRPDGSGRRRIAGSRPEDADGYPTAPTSIWSPDGRTIYFIGDIAGDDRNSAVFAMRTDGGARRRLTPTVRRIHGFDLSPDGRRIAVSADFGRGGGPARDLYVVGVDGGREDNITNGGDNRDPQWSPDGRDIAFTRGGDIYVIAADGSDLRNVTRSRGIDSAPAWRP